MDAHQAKASGSVAKSRKRGIGSGSRGRKKQKRLDAIVDMPPTPVADLSPREDAADSDDPGLLRRSSRVRRAPVMLDSSPVPPNRRRSNFGGRRTPRGTGVSQNGKMIREGKKNRRGVSVGSSSARKAIDFVSQDDRNSLDDGVEEEGSGDWGSRLRSRGGKGRGGSAPTSPIAKSKSPQKQGGDFREDKELSEQLQEETGESPKLVLEETVGTIPQASYSKGKKRRRRKKKQKKVKAKDRDEAPLTPESAEEKNLEKIDKGGSCEKNSPDDNLAAALSLNDGGCGLEKTVDKDCSSEKKMKHEEITVVSDSPSKDCEHHECLVNNEEIGQQQDVEILMDGSGDNPEHSVGEKAELSSHRLGDDDSPDNGTESLPGKLDSRPPETEVPFEEANLKDATPNDVPGRLKARESRRCSLCGRGSDGKPAKKLVHESADSDNEAYIGSSASEEPNYDVWDGFGDEPEWLGRLLGPIRDRFGITRIWVHQHCAVWSPEVYFAGLGCLKNVRAALSRGRALKCCRCGRPGATIGCRVDRCPKTYHLPCARADGCIFDHRKFLIACTDHRHLFQPQGNLYLCHVKKLKAKKMKFDLRKLSNESCRKDLEAEDRWFENCGEDEEFLKRESKRLHRDILRIAPVFIGSSLSENKNLFQGWESVAGLQDVIQCMKEVVVLPLLYPEFFSSLGLTPPRGVLLHGYPGTGKTMVVRSLIGECSRGNKRIAYFARKGADCLGKYVGDAERQLRLLFQAAEKLQPSIIFFDEIDGLAPCRSRQQDQTHSSVVSTLLSLLDGLKSRGSVIVIGATNRPEAIDPALRRPGRFDREIYFPLPSAQDRSAILSLHTKSWPKPISEPVLSWVAKETAGYAGADLQALCTQAAMIALKRNCPLQELLSSAEKNPTSGICLRPSLPSFVVQEGDWLEALASAPPPCSRREAGIAANDVASLPLQSHLLPCLLQPLSQLFISFYLDERIWLPLAIFKASKYIKSVIFSSLEQKKIPQVFWTSHLHYLIQEPIIVQEIERALSESGLLISPSTAFSYKLNENSCDGSDDFDSYRMNPDVCRPSNFTRKLLGFRLLIAGMPRSGQQHLASCLIHGFMGHIEIQKINLATISQEGHGDIIQGVTQILLKCLSLRRCVIYMPRIDLWAVDETCQLDVDEKGSSLKTLVSAKGGGMHDETKKTSQAWDSFIEQVDSLCASSLIILATSDVQIDDLPLGVRKFFTNGLSKSNDSAPSEHSIPRFSVHVDEKFNSDRFIDLFSEKLSQDLVQQYIQSIHHRIHVNNIPEKNEVSHMSKVYPEAQKGNNIKHLKATETAGAPLGFEGMASTCEASCRENEIQEDANHDERQPSTPKTRGNEEAFLQRHCHHLTHPKFPHKVMKGNLMLAIASFGYQILRFPHFAELCWATSKLKGGPCADISGNWKVWPFNSCFMHDINSSGNVCDESNSKNCKDRKNSGVVRGLVAVGLLAYRGAYMSVREVSFEVRKVLELLVREITVKILGGKDQYCFLRILSQVAYFEDMVNSWAYTSQSLQMESPVLESNMCQVFVEKQNSNDKANDDEELDKDGVIPNNNEELDKDGVIPNISEEKNNIVQDMVQEQCPQSLATDNGNCVNQSGIISEVEPSQEIASSTTLASKLDSLPSATAAPEESCRWESSSMSESPKVPNCLQVTETCPDKQCGNDSAGLNAAVPSVNLDVDISDKLVEETECSLAKDDNTSANSEISCVYECCSQCLRVLYVLTRKLLIDCWEDSGRCSTVDDVHDVVSSCSASLLAATSRCLVSHSNIKEYSNKQCGSLDQCSCQGIDNILEKSTELSTLDRSCHLKETEVAAVPNTCRVSPSKSALKFFFRNNTLVSSFPCQDTLLHCNFHKLCICSMINTILLIKKPSD